MTVTKALADMGIKEALKDLAKKEAPADMAITEELVHIVLHISKALATVVDQVALRFMEVNKSLIMVLL